MDKDLPDPLLSSPLQPGLLRICPRCQKWFALRFVASEPDVNYGKLKQYRCRSCEQVTVFAAELPQGVD